MPREDLIKVQNRPKVVVSLDPARNILCSMGLLIGCKDVHGINSFINKTHRQMNKEQRLNHHVIFHGLHYIIYPEQIFSEFKDYLDDLKKIDPNILVDRLFTNYARNIRFKEGLAGSKFETVSREEQKKILKSKVSYFEYLSRSFDDDCIDFNIEAKAYNYLLKTEQMKHFIISHIEFMWETFFKDEWEKNRPVLENAVVSYNQHSFSHLKPMDAVKKITGRDISSEWDQKPWKREMIEQLNQFVFIPSLHLGPYLTKSIQNNNIYIKFSPRVIQGVEFTSSELTHNDISVRLNTLSDPTRLKILKSVSQSQEISSKEIMEVFDLSQSAASRHLKQLSATGFLKERRQNSAKIYSIDPQVLTKTLEAVSKYLLED